MTASSKRRTAVWLPVVGVTLVVIIAAVALVTFLGGDEESGGRYPRPLTSEPSLTGEFDVDGSPTVIGWSGDDLLLLIDFRQVVAIDPETGKRSWRRSANDVVLTPEGIVVLDEDELVRLDAAGKRVGDPLDVEGATGIRTNGRQVFVFGAGSDETTIFDLSTWEEVAGGTFAVSPSGATLYDVSPRSSGIRFRSIDASTGQSNGDWFEVEDVEDYSALDDGRLVILGDGEVRIFDAAGTEIASESVSDGSGGISTAGDVIFASDFSEDTGVVLRVDGDQIVEVDELDGFSFAFEMDGEVWALTNDRRLGIHLIGADGVEEQFEVRGSFARLVDGGLMARDEDELDFFTIPGQGDSEWTLDVGDETSVTVIDRAVVVVEYDIDADESTVGVYR